jgi:hypothetical protein
MSMVPHKIGSIRESRLYDKVRSPGGRHTISANSKPLWKKALGQKIGHQVVEFVKKKAGGEKSWGTVPLRMKDRFSLQLTPPPPKLYILLLSEWRSRLSGWETFIYWTSGVTTSSASFSLLDGILPVAGAAPSMFLFRFRDIRSKDTRIGLNRIKI